MLLIDLAKEMGIPVEEAYVHLAHHEPTWFLDPDPNIFQVNIPPYLLDLAREVILKGRAQEVIDHVKDAASSHHR